MYIILGKKKKFEIEDFVEACRIARNQGNKTGDRIKVTKDGKEVYRTR